jgi:hypothetical protein
VDEVSSVGLRHRRSRDRRPHVAGRLHHIGVGRTYSGTRVLILIQDLHVKIINAATGEPLRELTLDPTKGLPAHRRPQRPQTEKDPNLMQVRTYSDVLRHHSVPPAGFEPVEYSRRT